MTDPHVRPAPGTDPERKLRVLVIDDSSFFRQSIADMITRTGRYDVVGRAADGVEAMAMVRRAMPDLITLDLEMPRMNGFSFLRWVMMNRPVPVLVLSSHDSRASVFHALELGAVDFVGKPSHRASIDIFGIERELCQKLDAIARIGPDVLTRRQAVLQPQTLAPVRPVRAAPAGRSTVSLVVIGASTGGPPAIQTILRSLPPNFPAPIIVVQHMPAVFTQHFAERLNYHCPFAVKEAQEGDLLEPGGVLVAPGGHHLAFGEPGARQRVSLMRKGEQDRYAPCINITLQAAAPLFGQGLLAVLLTGMGNDGADGMKAVKANGGRTIAESEESAAIFGMPNEAIKAGVVDTVLPVDRIAAAVLALADTRADRSE